MTCSLRLLVRATVLLGLAGPVLSARCEDRHPADFFGQEVADAMVRRLQPTEPPEMPVPNLKLSRSIRPLPELRAVLIEGVLTNTGDAPVRLARVPLADWRFRVNGGVDAVNFQSLEYRNEQWYDSTYWTGPNWTRVGRNWHHPGEKTPSVRRFTVPADGRVTVTGRVAKAHLDGDGIVASILHNGKSIWQATLEGVDKTGQDPNLTLDVKKNDTLRFVVDKRFSIVCDTTWWDPIVTYADGRRFQASEQFATRREDRREWTYEMLLDPNALPSIPQVAAVTREFALRSEPAMPDVPVRMDGADCRPLLLLGSDDGQSGVFVGINSTRAWQCTATFAGNGTLEINLALETGDEPLVVEPGRSISVPAVLFGAFDGPPQRGMGVVGDVLEADPGKLPLAAFRESFSSGQCDDLPLLMLVQTEWRIEDRVTESPESYAEATRKHLGKAVELLAALRAEHGTGFLPDRDGQLAALSTETDEKDLDLARWRSLYYRTRWAKREIALANPLMDFDKLLLCKRTPTSYSHLVMQYFGWRAQSGGGIFVLEKPGRSLACRDILGGRLAHGNVLEPRLSYDGKRIAFSFAACGGENPVAKTSPDECDEDHYHIYEVNVDGSGLRQLTHGPFDDLMPEYLPDGGIVFTSTRRKGYARCFGSQFGPRWHVYTLHRMDGDGTNIRTISYHDTNEWFPTVDNNGRVLYARWDYIDRDAVTHQNLWSTRPDGTDPITVWGNGTPSPHCTFQMKPIPGSSRIVFAASAHHSVAGGSIAIVDPTIDYDGQHAITRITPEIPFPEAEGRNITEYYTSPWPLSEKYFLVGYSYKPLVWEPGANPRDALGIYLLDASGNRELVYRDGAIGSTNPCPLRPRTAPPVIPSGLPAAAPPTGEVALMDVYRGLGDVPRGTIRQLRVIQIFPKTTIVANTPQMGIAGEENGRAILGTVPVEADGSARFIVPAQKPILFQALDEDGFAVQTMRTITYLQPGEKVACVGCHENRMTAPTESPGLALRRPPGRIDPGPLGGRPFGFAEMVQPVLDRHCVRCHGGEKTEGKIDLSGAAQPPWSRSYLALVNHKPELVPRFRARNQIQVTPVGGIHGALGSRLMALLREGHEDVRLSADELRRLAAWIDCNAIFFGSPEPAQHPRQLEGRPVPMPEIQ